MKAPGSPKTRTQDGAKIRAFRNACFSGNGISMSGRPEPRLVRCRPCAAAMRSAAWSCLSFAEFNQDSIGIAAERDLVDDVAVVSLARSLDQFDAGLLQPAV